MNSVDRDSIHLTHHFIIFFLFRDKRELGLQVTMAGECLGHTGPVQVWTIVNEHPYSVQLSDSVLLLAYWI